MTGTPDILRGTCGTCKWFDRGVEEPKAGFCRESSPQVAIIELPQQNALTREVRMIPQVVANFPQVGEDCWCGKWVSRLVLRGMN